MKIYPNREAARADGCVIYEGLSIAARKDGEFFGVVRSELEEKQNEVLKELEWSGDHGNGPICPDCLSPESEGHAHQTGSFCKLDAALKAFRGTP